MMTPEAEHAEVDDLDGLQEDSATVASQLGFCDGIVDAVREISPIPPIPPFGGLDC